MTHGCGNATKHTQRIGCCAACKRLFSSDSAFEKHRRGGQCYDPRTLKGGLGLLKPRPSRTAPGETVWSLASDDERFAT